MFANRNIYEQYCWVIGENVYLENKYNKPAPCRVLHCKHKAACDKKGGCKNSVVCSQLSVLS